MRDGLAYGFAGERQRGLADLLLAARKVEVERAARRTAGVKNVEEGGAVITVTAEQARRRRDRFLFRIGYLGRGASYRLL